MSQAHQIHPIVMRMQGMSPRDLAGYIRHLKRACGDVGHCDPDAKVRNRQLIGTATWAQDTWDRIQDMRHANHDREIAQLRKRRRKKDLELALFHGPQDPWRPSRHGPMREIILTVNKKWFDEDLTSFLNEEGPTREQLFEQHAKEWLINNFGDKCVHARADLDETTYHIHAVIVPDYASKGERQMLQPTRHPLIRDYEKAQDDVGAWFAQIGLKRGERRKQAIREAIKHNEAIRKARASGKPVTETEVPVPERRKHVSPRHWREKQERALAARDKAVKKAEQTLAAARASLADKERTAEQQHQAAQTVLDVAAAVADGRIDVTSEAKAPQSPPAKPSQAQVIFGRAIEVLRKRARKEARAELADEFAQIRAADRALLEIAKTLPERARRRLAEARQSLTRPLNALRLSMKAQSRRGDRSPDEKS